MSSGSVRMQNGLDAEKDPWLIHYTGPRATSPLAVSFIPQYRTFLLMHALFALADVRLETISTLFGTVFVDMIRYMEEEWDTLVACIEHGTLPGYDGVEAIQPYLQKQWQPRPERAAELREVEVNSPTWLHKIWPNLKVVVGIASGTFASVIPKMRMILGDTVYLRSLGFTASEAYVGTVYGHGDINCFKTVSDDIVEYLDASLPEADQTPDRCVMPWEVEAGKQYEIILTTRDGLWRYRLGDVVEVTGFEPSDGSPIIKYIERKNIAMRFPEAQIHEQELVSSIVYLDDSTLGPVAEFTVCEDTRSTPSTVGYIVELASSSSSATTSGLGLGADPSAAPQKVLESLMELNEGVRIGYEEGSISVPTIRVVSGGSFREYRRWRIEKTKSGAGQMKVPVVMRDEESLKWLLERVVFEANTGNKF
ncbi:hypothetical protein CONPUDRAFT_134583 [Coniophora puteana RWD-64-598 SS2]|uniref:GH3 auxin-responsive promoter n=1 Tax=Coniophora puteana (strain RWD-64-598) TaxID=741705 RepID=A0A5M3N7L3_CONPW|nr:uncharacterized protein CONPUDRAFT_134583 [Coniophora puteana RWD-64-598 SS2]EIW87440.1 hypothetical protein CONPUDRAFT_134583 [Coniophora puteana RWD-64-598 SS2]